MAIQSFMLDPNAQAYTNDQIVAKVNAASDVITRADSVSPAARPIGVGEIDAEALADGAAKANLDAMADTERGYVQTKPVSGQWPIISIERHSDGRQKTDYDDAVIP